MNDLLTIVSEIERLSKEATVNWEEPDFESFDKRLDISGSYLSVDWDDVDPDEAKADCQFAVYARNNADTLVEQVRALSEENERLKKALEQAGPKLLTMFQNEKEGYVISFDAQWKDSRKYDAPDLVEFVRARAALADKGATS